MHTAVGIHVFAGGFTMGMQRAGFEVRHQLERHGFGVETAEALTGVSVINDAAADWPRVPAEVAYGNPRCTAFSTITGGYHTGVHGPWAQQCQDILDLARYAAGEYDVVAFESVQQCFSTGRPLLDKLRDELFVPRGYRIAHVLVSAQALGNPQRRRRYFFVAYRGGGRTFNVEPPRLPNYYATAWDVLWPGLDRVTNESALRDDWDRDSYARPSPADAETIRNLPNGWDYNCMGRYALDKMSAEHQRVWRLRTSSMPFSLHCPYRLHWMNPMPTLFSTSFQLVHPWLHRRLTVGELATTMGWPDVPRGRDPVAQIVKGLVPDAGAWIGRQIALFLDGAWGCDDWESSYDHRRGEWRGERNASAKVEKVFNLTNYVPRNFDVERFPKKVRVPRFPRPGVTNDDTF